MATVRKRLTTCDGKPVERWLVDYADARGVRRSKTFDKKKEADAYLDKVKRDLFEGVHMAASEVITFSALADLYTRDCHRRWRLGDIAGNTFDLASRLVDNHLIPHFGKYKVDEIDGKAAQAFIDLKSEKYSRVTVIKLRKHLKDVLQFGVERDYLRRNVMRDRPTRIPREAAGQIEIPSLDDLKRLVSVVQGRRHVHRERFARPQIERIVVFCALFCGMRRGEIAGLTWRHVDFAAGLIRIRHSRSRFDGLKGPKTKAGLRDVAMPELLQSELLKLQVERGACDPDNPVLLNRFGKPIHPDEISHQYWEPVAIAANMRRRDGSFFGLHSLRHAAASLWIRGGLPMLAVKKAIGHSSISTTMDVYGHLFPEDEMTRRAVVNSAASLTSEPMTIDVPPASVSHGDAAASGLHLAI